MSQQYLLSLGLLFLLCLVCAGTAQTPPAAVNGPFKNEREKASYAFGMNIGRGWKKGGIEMDPEALARGVKDALAGGPTLLTETEMNQMLARFTRDLRYFQRQHHDQLAEKNRREGEAFLERNRTFPGVVSLPSGLQYQVLAQGTGQSPTATNWVSLKLRGTRIDGTECETSYGYPRANSFCAGALIPAWAEAVQLMRPGARWRLFVPPSLAYGKEGSHYAGPDETIIYDLDLVAILDGPLKDIRTEIAPDND